MIQDRMAIYTAEIRQEGKNEYGEPLTGYIFYKPTEVSITLINKIINVLDVRYATATHLGLTYDRTLVEGMRLVDEEFTYDIKIINPDGRLVQLTLEKI